jgi:hypothetical protein
MDNGKKWYERKGRTKPCYLNKDDVAALSEIIEEGFTRAEKERFFRISTTLGSSRTFSGSTREFLGQPGLPDQINDLSFIIEGWDAESRFSKNILLDFSKYSVQVCVEGADPVWVYDRYNQIVKFLESKTAWYWPIIVMEKYFVFVITISLVGNIIISSLSRQPFVYLDKLGLLGLWVFLVFYDTRSIWPYSRIRLRGRKSLLSAENLVALLALLIFALAILSGMVAPLVR